MKLCLAALLLPATLFAQPKSLLIEDMTWTEVRDAIAAILDRTTLAMVCEKVDSAREKQGDTSSLMYYI